MGAAMDTATPMAHSSVWRKSGMRLSVGLDYTRRLEGSAQPPSAVITGKNSIV